MVILMLMLVLVLMLMLKLMIMLKLTPWAQRDAKRAGRWQSLAHHKNKLDSCSLGIFPQPGIQRLLFRSPQKAESSHDS